MQARMKQIRRRLRGVTYLFFKRNNFDFLRVIGMYLLCKFVGRAVSTKSIAHEIIISSDIFGTKEVI